MEKYLDITKPHYSEQILPVRWHFIILRFHCNTKKSSDSFQYPKNPSFNQATQIFWPQKIAESKISNRQKSFNHLRHLKAGVAQHPPPPLPLPRRIWVVMHHQYGISALISQMSLCREPVVASWNVSCFLRLELLWQWCLPHFETINDLTRNLTRYLFQFQT